MTKPSKTQNPKVPTVRQSLAQISESLSRIALSLNDGKGDSALENIGYALYDIAEYGAGKVPKKLYDWRHVKV